MITDKIIAKKLLEIAQNKKKYNEQQKEILDQAKPLLLNLINNEVLNTEYLKLDKNGEYVRYLFELFLDIDMDDIDTHGLIFSDILIFEKMKNEFLASNFTKKGISNMFKIIDVKNDTWINTFGLSSEFESPLLVDVSQQNDLYKKFIRIAVGVDFDEKDRLIGVHLFLFNDYGFEMACNDIKTKYQGHNLENILEYIKEYLQENILNVSYHGGKLYDKKNLIQYDLNRICDHHFDAKKLSGNIKDYLFKQELSPIDEEIIDTDDIFDIISNVLQNMTLSYILEQMRKAGDSVHVDLNYIESKSPNPHQKISSLYETIIDNKINYINFIRDLIGIDNIYLGDPDITSEVYIFDGTELVLDKQINYLYQNQLNITLPYNIHTIAFDNKYLDELKLRHGIVMGAISLLSPLIDTVYGYPYYNFLDHTEVNGKYPRSRIRCGLMSSHFTQKKFSSIYEYDNKCYESKYPSDTTYFFDVYYKKIVNTLGNIVEQDKTRSITDGLYEYKGELPGCEFRVNNAFHSPCNGLFFGFETRIFPYVPHKDMEHIIRFVVVLSDYVWHKYLTNSKSNNIKKLDELFMSQSDLNKNIADIFVNILFAGWHYIVDVEYLNLIEKYLDLKIEKEKKMNVYELLNYIYDLMLKYLNKLLFKNNKILFAMDYMDEKKNITNKIPNINRDAINSVIEKYIRTNFNNIEIPKIKISNKEDININDEAINSIMLKLKIHNDDMVDVIYYLIDKKYIDIPESLINDLKIVFKQKGGYDYYLNKYKKYKIKYHQLKKINTKKY